MTIKLLSSVMLVVAGTSCATASSVGSVRVLENAQIFARSNRPPPSGYLSSWIKIGVKSEAGARNLFYQYFGESQVIPEIGQVCAISYHVEAVNGITADEALSLPKANVVDSIECRKPGSK